MLLFLMWWPRWRHISGDQHPACAQEWQNVFQIGGAALGGAIAPATGGSEPTTPAEARTTALAQVTMIDNSHLQAPGWHALCRCHLLRCLTGLRIVDLTSEGVTGASFFPAEMRAAYVMCQRRCFVVCVLLAVCVRCLCARGACVDVRSAKPCLLNS
jgi:hypothetical protein